MKPEIWSKIDIINQEFYQEFAHSFDRTRQRIQAGVARVLEQIPREGSWLDIGCGNGCLAVEWVRQRRSGLYYGIDFSRPLIQEAQKRCAEKGLPSDLKIEFYLADLTDKDWTEGLPRTDWDGLMMFAVLHHIAGGERRQGILRMMRSLVSAGAVLYLSVWQLHNSPRLMKRLQPWSAVGIDEGELEAGDELIDWRSGLATDRSPIGLRYVHLFSADELNILAGNCGFEVVDGFYSDGHAGNLSLYQRWLAIK